MKSKKTKKNFSSFTLNEALQELQVLKLERWEIPLQPYQVSSFFSEHLQRLESFDLVFSERAKELLIDAICAEVIVHHPRLKVWKAAALQSDTLMGYVDYLVSPNIAYMTTPLLCAVEAKKDDFEKGMAQCLVEMKSCSLNNQQAGKAIDVYGIVTNGEVWKFYRLTTGGQVYETLSYSTETPEKVFAALTYVFSKCEENLETFQVMAKAA
jgi:hypothetical protein